MIKNFEILLAREKENCFDIIGITYSNAMMVEPDCTTLRASLFAIEDCKKALRDGKKISVAKVQDYSEILPSDLIIEEVDELQRAKLIAINEISARLHQLLISISIIDLMEYLNNYIALINAGYFITDKNREDKYFEVIERSQEVEEPKELQENATFEDEQKYIEAKQKYDTAQYDLHVLENYLNSYDKLQKIRDITSFLNETREKVNNSDTLDAIQEIMQIYNSNLINYNIVKCK